MKTLRANDYDMSYVEAGEGRPLVCVHGSMSDYRVWTFVFAALAATHRVVTPSLRRFYPERWDGKGGGFSIAQHVGDVIGFIEALNLGPVDLLGHSRGGHIAFRVAQRRPDLLRRLVLAEPGGELDASLATPDMPKAVSGEPLSRAAAMIADGDIDGGLKTFIDAIDGAGAWDRIPEMFRGPIRDNAGTLIAQVHEARPSYSRADVESVKLPTLLIGGALTKGLLPVILHRLAETMPDARAVMIEGAGHTMFAQRPHEFVAAVDAFLA
jgi:pimeloyl-ACP methyl ester carboxylesterase